MSDLDKLIEQMVARDFIVLPITEGDRTEASVLLAWVKRAYAKKHRP